MCKYGHKWLATPTSIKCGIWCPYCSAFKSENICRWVFEQIFKEKFIKTRPLWLVSSSGTRLELDGFCEKLNLAFEHNGIQHFKRAFKMTDKDLAKIKLNDKLKVKLCKKHGVKLIVIDQLFVKTSFDSLKDTVKKAYFMLFHKQYYGQDLTLDIAPSFNENRQIIIEDIAKLKGGKCLSNYIKSSVKMKFRCSNGHVWFATPNKIMMGRWCKKCGHKTTGEKLKYSIDDMRKIAIKRGGKCLSAQYKDNKTKLEWECKFGHKWFSSTASIKCKNTWCPLCAVKRNSIKRKNVELVFD
jgi:hypothetical protein